MWGKGQELGKMWLLRMESQKADALGILTPKGAQAPLLS